MIIVVLGNFIVMGMIAYDMRQIRHDYVLLQEQLIHVNNHCYTNVAVGLRSYHYIKGHDVELNGPILACPECWEIYNNMGDNRFEPPNVE